MEARLFTSSEVGALLQVNASSVKKWIDEGRLTAFRTPGGHRRVRATDLVDFLEVHRMPIPMDLEKAGRRRVLVVDDDVSVLKALQRSLKRYAAQLEVVTCENGIDALVRIGAFRPHLILLDIVMPRIDGLEVCRRLKANLETRGIQVIFVTGHNTPQIERKALEAGATRCLAKPIEVSELLTVLGVSVGARLTHP